MPNITFLVDKDIYLEKPINIKPKAQADAKAHRYPHQ
jgi:hypothetical protein